MLNARVAELFGLGPALSGPVPVPGGLSNELWRVGTAAGEFAVKRMVVNAGNDDFVANVEAAFAVERRAWAAGVAMPEPVPDPATGRALLRIDGELYRAHRWVDGVAGEGTGGDAARLLAAIHAAGPARWEEPPRPWAADHWGADVARLGRRVAAAPDRVLTVDSHRDLDRKNTLRRGDGILVALDWDAAGAAPAVYEAVAVALDWSGGDAAAFVAAVTAYGRGAGVVVGPEPWIFGGWVAAQGGWLDHQAANGGDVAGPLALLRRLAAGMDRLLVELC